MWVPKEKREQRRLLTLDVFIQQGLAYGDEIKWPKNEWVSRQGFSALYVRLTRRAIDGTIYTPVLDLANMTAREPGKGTFTKLVAKLRHEYPQLHLFVEQVLEERFGVRLEKLGFIKLDPAIHGMSYFMKAGE